MRNQPNHQLNTHAFICKKSPEGLWRECVGIEPTYARITAIRLELKSR
jgi:hypothetical protein